MKFPKRVPQHISESVSFRIFSSNVPDNWIIREIGERDYGIDFYVELVNENDELTGQLVMIQLKSKKSIQWNKKGEFRINGVKISTSNYWFKFATPVFVMIVDELLEKVYFLSTSQFIRRNFDKYVQQNNFSYTIKKDNLIDKLDNLYAFRFHFYFEYYRSQFENELVYFTSNFEKYEEFCDAHSFRDFHLGLEIEDQLFFETLHRNLYFLSIYLAVDFILPTMKEIRNRSIETFPKGLFGLYEHDLNIISSDLSKLITQLKTKIIAFVKSEKQYWTRINPTMYEWTIRMR